MFGGGPGDVAEAPSIPQKRDTIETVNAIEGQRGIVLVVFDGVKLLDAAGPAEVFAEANRFGAGYCLSFVSVDGEDVTTTVGTKVAVTGSISSIQSADTVLVAGGDVLVGRPIDPQLVEAVGSVLPRTRGWHRSARERSSWLRPVS